MQALGRNSKAVHRAYAKQAHVKLPSHRYNNHQRKDVLGISQVTTILNRDRRRPMLNHGKEPNIGRTKK